MKTQKEIKQISRLKTMKEMESHSPLVVQSLNEQIERLESK
jgi:hypothetical protein